MDERIKELIAIGASVTANCQPCLVYHVDKARQHGVCDDEIAAAVKVGKMVRKGSSHKMDEHIDAVLSGGKSGCGGSDEVCDLD